MADLMILEYDYNKQSMYLLMYLIFSDLFPLIFDHPFFILIIIPYKFQKA